MKMLDRGSASGAPHGEPPLPLGHMWQVDAVSEDLALCLNALGPLLILLGASMQATREAQRRRRGRHAFRESRLLASLRRNWQVWSWGWIVAGSAMTAIS